MGKSRMSEQDVNPNMDEKVVSIKDLIRIKSLKKEEESLIRYYKALDFGTLLSETNEIIRKIKSHTLRADLTNQSKLLLKEFKTRLDSAPFEWKEHIKKMKEEISKRIDELNKNGSSV